MRSFKTKLLIVSFFLMILAILVSSSLSILFINQVENSDATEMISNLSDSEQQKINKILSSVEQSVNTMGNIAIEAYKPEYKTGTAEFDQYNEQMSKIFIEISNHTETTLTIYYRYNVETFGPTAGFWYGKIDGEMVSKPTTNLSLYDKNDIQNSAWYYYPYQKGKACWIEPFYDKQAKMYVLSYAAPIYSGKTFIGVVGMEIDFASVTGLVSQIDMYENGNAYIVNKNNKIMYHETISYMSNKPSLPEDYLEVKRELNNEMTLVLSAPKDSISKKGQTSRTKVIIYSLIILSAELVLAFLALSKMTSPITELTKASKKFKEGKFDVKLNVDAMGDFKDLADGVQTLIDELNERIENVNKLAFTDSLTGVFNKTAYVDHALRLNKNVEKRRFAVVVLHLFNLIPMNDRFGREMGNEFLLTATEFISSVFNKSNVYRITGGLYTIILEDSEYERKEFLFKTFVEELKEQSIMIEQEEVQLPIAIGMAEFNKRKDKTVEDVYARADKFMQANREYIKQNLNN